MAVTIRVNADTSAARQDLRRLETSVANIDKTTKNVSRSLTRLATGIATAFGTTVAVRSINKTADSLTELENRIALVTGRTDQLGKSLNNLYSIARQSRTSVQLAGETFNRFGLALKSSGASVADIEKATLSVGKALAISGGNAESASAAIFQLGQGLASGTLRGQELNSVLEQAPRIASAIADELGVAQGELRGLAEEGKLTTEVVFNALLNQSGKLSKEFEDLNSTSSQAFTVLRDNFGRLAANINRVLGFTQTFTEAYEGLTDVIITQGSEIELKLYSSIVRVGQAFDGVRLILGGVVAVITSLAERIGNAIYTAILPRRTLLDRVKSGLLTPLLEAERQVRILGLTFGAFFDNLTFTAAQGNITRLFRAGSAEEARAVLDALGESISLYERRSFNLGNVLTNMFIPVRNGVTGVLIDMGILEQRLVRFRPTSFEDLNFVLELTSELINDVAKNLKALRIFRIIIVEVYKFNQVFTRVIEAIGNDFERLSSKITAQFNKLFTSASSVARSNLGAAKDYILGALTEIERKFFWLYDEVIGNSWWTDTMEQTFGLAKEFLGKTIAVVSDFGNKVVTTFKSVFETSSGYFRSFVGSLKANIPEISIDVDFRAEAGNFFSDPIAYIKSSLKSLVVAIGKPIGDAAALFYQRMKELSPTLTGIFAAIIGTQLIGLVSTSFAKGLNGFIRTGILASLGLVLVEAFGDSILSSGFIGDFAEGLGIAAGSFINLILTNIPKIAAAFVQAAKGFGEGLAEAIDGIPGLIIKAFTALDLGAILFGSVGLGLTAYLTGFGFNKKIDESIKKRQKDFDKLSGDFQKKQVAFEAAAISSSTNLARKIPGQAPKVPFLESVLIGRGGGRETLFKFGAQFFLAQAIVGQFIEDSFFRDVVVVGGILGSLLYSEQTNAVANKAFSLLRGFTNKAKGVLATAFASPAGKTGFAGFVDGITSAIVRASTGLEGIGFKAGRGFAFLSSAASTAFSGILGSLGGLQASFLNNWGGMLSSASGVFSNFASRVRRNSGKLALGVAAIFIFSASQAEAAANNAADGAEAATQGFIAKFADFITSPGGLIGLLFFGKDIAATISGAFKLIISGIGPAMKTLRAGVLALGILGGGSVFAGIATALGIAAGAVASFLAASATIVAGLAIGAGLIGIAVFGEGDSFKEKLGNTYDSVLKSMGLLSRGASKLRDDLDASLGGFKDIGDIKINFRGLLDATNFEGFDQEEASKVRRLAERANTILEDAQKTMETEGELSRAQTRRVERAVLLVEQAIKEGQGAGDPEAQALTSRLLTGPLSDTLRLGGGSFDRFTQVQDEFNFNRNLGLEDDSVSEDTFDALRKFRDAVAEGEDVFDSLFNIVGNEQIEQELTASAAGSDLFGIFEKILLAQVGNVDLGPEAASSINAALLAVSDVFNDASVPKSEVASSLQAAVDTISSAIDTEQSVLRRTIRAAAEEKFTSAGGRFLDTLGDALDGSTDLDRIIPRLSNEGLSDFTETFENIEKRYADQLEELTDKGSLINVEERVRRIEQIEGSAQQAFDRLLTSVGLDDSTAEEAVARLDEINKRLTAIDANTLNMLPSNSVEQAATDESAVVTENTRLIDLLNQIDAKQAELASGNLVGEVYNEAVLEVVKLKDQLGFLVNNANAANAAQVDALGALEDALSKVDDAIDLDEALSLGSDKVAEVLRLSSALDILNLSLEQLALGQSGNFDAQVGAYIANQRAQIQESLDKILTDPEAGSKKTGGAKDTRTVYQKLIEGLSNAGFALTDGTAAGLGLDTLTQINKKQQEYEAAQKRINSLALDDVEARRAAVAELDKLRTGIEDLLSQSTFGGLTTVIEGLGGGLDMTQILGLGEEGIQNYVANLQRIAEIEEEISNLSVDKVDEAIALNEELERRLQLEQKINEAQANYEGIKSGVKDALSAALKDVEKFEDFFDVILDDITSRIIDTVVDSFTEALFESLGLKDLFTDLFAGLFDFGDSIGKSVGEDISGAISGAVSEDSGGILKSLTSLFEGIGEFFKGLGGGGGGGGGFFSSLLGLFGGGGGVPVVTANSGGLIKPMGTTRTDIDSVPAMLTPGELVVPADKVDGLINGNAVGGSNQTFNISVSGDVSRQTRKEIVQMLPQIAAGVNTQNRENNYRR